MKCVESIIKEYKEENQTDKNYDKIDVIFEFWQNGVKDKEGKNKFDSLKHLSKEEKESLKDEEEVKTMIIAYFLNKVETLA